ncbi:hypothetical protein K2X89_01995 [Myxococcota bacterium]|nr:hypothetical protein [Myxococcota bacterium]
MHDRGKRPTDPGSRDHVFLDESSMRVLLVADRPRLVAGLRAVLEKSSRCRFELTHEQELAQAAARIRGPVFDLLVIDLALAGHRRSAVVDVASELATRLPVVALSGTEALVVAGSSAAIDARDRLLQDDLLSERLEAAELPALLMRTRRRARRLGAMALSPVFCRFDHPGA